MKKENKSTVKKLFVVYKLPRSSFGSSNLHGSGWLPVIKKSFARLCQVSVSALRSLQKEHLVLT
jgi:hypothetical protein